MFRQKALDRLKSPEDLDNAMVVIPMRSWIFLSAILFLTVVALVWSIVGRIPITVNGVGVLINPGNVSGIQSRGAGQVIELYVRVGEAVKKNQVIAKLNQPDIQKQLDQERTRYDDLVAADENFEKLESERLVLERKSIREQSDFIAREVISSKKLETRLNSEYVEFAKQRRENLEKTQVLNKELNVALKKRVDAMKALRAEGLASEDLLLSVQGQFMDSEAKIADYIVRLEEIELGEVQREQSTVERQNRLVDLEMQLMKLTIRDQQLVQEDIQTKQARKQQIREIKNSIDRLEINLQQQGEIVAAHPGRILEMNIGVGTIVQPGMRIGTLEIDDPKAELKNLAYLDVKGGKLIKPGDRIDVTPATVERERFGSIVGRVTKVSPFPVTREGAVSVLGSEEIAQSLMSQGGAIEIEAELLRDDKSFSGYKWTSQGPPLKLSAGTTTTVRVTTEDRSPISFVLPVLRAWVWGQKDDTLPKM